MNSPTTGLDGLSAHVPPTLTLRRTIFLAAAIVVTIQGLLLLTASNGVLHGSLFDPDCYMHLQRAYRLMTGAGWPTAADPRINAPFGYSIHWTSLFDLLLVLGATPLRWLGEEPHAALYIWGSCIGPLLLIGALAVLAWALKPWVNGASFLWLTVLVFTQPQFSGSFLVGRPDHHSLVMALLIVQLAWLYAYFDRRAGFRWTCAAGVAAGLQMITSVEALVSVLVVAAALAFGWLFCRQRTLATLTVYLLACVLTMAGWLVLTQPQDFFHLAYDRISIVHIVALTCGGIAIAALAAADARGWFEGRMIRSAAALTLAVALSGSVTALWFPDFFRGPWPHLDPVVMTWHRKINELQPLLPTDWSSTAQFFAQLTAPLLSIPLILSRVRKGSQPFLLPSLIGLVVFGAIALFQMRWSAEVQAATLLPWTLATRQIMRSPMALRIGQSTLPLRAFALGGALLLQMVPAELARARPTAFAGSGACSWKAASESLQAMRLRNEIILTSLWRGPEILWRTSLRVIGGPYEIAPALSDTMSFEKGDERNARRIIEQRSVNFVLVCDAEDTGDFVDRLRRGSAPGWLQPVGLPGSPAGFRLYRVN